MGGKVPQVKDRKPRRRLTVRGSGVPQGSTLAPTLSFVYVDDMPEGVISHMSLFALLGHTGNANTVKFYTMAFNRIWKGV